MYRFSSRPRHKTDFYIPTLQGDRSSDGEVSTGKKKMRIYSVARKLHFEPYQTPLVAPPPDVPQALVVKKSYRKGKQDGLDNKESYDCEDDTKTSKEVIILTCYCHYMYIHCTYYVHVHCMCPIDIHVHVHDMYICFSSAFAGSGCLSARLTQSSHISCYSFKQCCYYSL